MFVFLRVGFGLSIHHLLIHSLTDSRSLNFFKSNQSCIIIIVSILPVILPIHPLAGRSRENVVKLEVVEKGVLNAIVFWFDLHLDEEETITSAPVGIDTGGKVTSHAETFMDPEAPEDGEDDGDGDAFVPSATFEGARAGWCFKLGPRGQGYYPDTGSSAREAACALRANHQQLQPTLDPESDPSDEEDGECESDHHWGQALQYLERSLFVDPKKVSGVDGSLSPKVFAGGGLFLPRANFSRPKKIASPDQARDPPRQEGRQRHSILSQAGRGHARGKEPLEGE